MLILWILSTLTVTAAACEWSSTAQELGTRDIILAGAPARFTLGSPVLDVQVDTRLDTVYDVPFLSTTFTSAQVVIDAVLDLGERYPMSNVGPTIQYGTYGTVPAGAAVHIVGVSVDSTSVSVVPASVRFGEVDIGDAVRSVPCDALALRHKVHSSGYETYQAADEITHFNMQKEFELRHSPAGEHTVRFKPKHPQMHVIRVETQGNRSRFEYHDRFGAIWTGWSTVSTMNAYNHRGMGGSIGYMGGYMGALGLYVDAHICEDQIPIRDAKGEQVGYVRAGASISTHTTSDGIWIAVPWIQYSDHGRLFIESLSGCSEI